MAHRFIDINEIPRKANSKAGEIENAIIKLAEVISLGKAARIDCEKIGRKPLTLYSIIRKLIKSGELPGVEFVSRNKCQDLYLSRKAAG